MNLQRAFSEAISKENCNNGKKNSNQLRKKMLKSSPKALLNMAEGIFEDYFKRVPLGIAKEVPKGLF